MYVGCCMYVSVTINFFIAFDPTPATLTFAHSHSLSLPDISPLIKLKLFHIYLSLTHSTPLIISLSHSLSLQGLEVVEVEMEVTPEVPSSTPTLTPSHSINIPLPSQTIVTVLMVIIIKIIMVIIVVIIMVIMVEIMVEIIVY